jgi:hypothetical protein
MWETISQGMHIENPEADGLPARLMSPGVFAFPQEKMRKRVIFMTKQKSCTKNS